MTNFNIGEKLSRRQSRYVRDSKQPGARKLPGSMNRHKTAPKGAGKRSRTSVKSDSQKATV